MWSSASPRRWAAATAISSRSLTFAWPVKSEKRDGRNVSSNAASGLFNVEIGRSAIALQNARTPNHRQGERADRHCESLVFAAGWVHLDNALACRRDGARHLCRFTAGKPTGQWFGPCRSDAEAA